MTETPDAGGTRRQSGAARRPDPAWRRHLADAEQRFAAGSRAEAIDALADLWSRPGGRHPEVACALGRMARALGRCGEVARVLSEAVAQWPHRPALREELARCGLAAGNAVAARDAMFPVTEAAPAARHLQLLACIEARLGDVASARALLDRCEPESRRSRGWREANATVLEYAGLQEDALRERLAMQACWPADREIRTACVRLLAARGDDAAILGLLHPLVEAGKVSGSEVPPFVAALLATGREACAVTCHAGLSRPWVRDAGRWKVIACALRAVGVAVDDGTSIADPLSAHACRDAERYAAALIRGGRLAALGTFAAELGGMGVREPGGLDAIRLLAQVFGQPMSVADNDAFLRALPTLPEAMIDILCNALIQPGAPVAGIGILAALVLAGADSRRQAMRMLRVALLLFSRGNGADGLRFLAASADGSESGMRALLRELDDAGRSRLYWAIHYAVDVVPDADLLLGLLDPVSDPSLRDGLIVEAAENLLSRGDREGAARLLGRLGACLTNCGAQARGVYLMRLLGVPLPERLPPGHEFPPDDILLDGLVQHHRYGRDACVVWFAPILSSNVAVFEAWCLPVWRRLGVSVLVVDDGHSLAGLNGVGELRGIETSAAWFRDTLRDLGYADVLTCGSSHSGLSALLYGAALGARGALLFSGMSFAPKESDLPDSRGVATVRRLQRKLRLECDDARPLVQDAPGMRVHQHYGCQSVFDARQAQHMAALPNVKCFGRDHDSHNVVLWLWQNGQLDGAICSFVADALAGRGDPALDRLSARASENAGQWQALLGWIADPASGHDWRPLTESLGDAGRIELFERVQDAGIAGVGAEFLASLLGGILNREVRASRMLHAIEALMAAGNPQGARLLLEILGPCVGNAGAAVRAGRIADMLGQPGAVVAGHPGGLLPDDVFDDGLVKHYRFGQSMCMVWFAPIIPSNIAVYESWCLPVWRRLGVSVLTVYDKRLLAALDGFGPYTGVEAGCGRLSGLLRDLGYRHVATCGTSLSGLTALLYGAALDARGALLFAGTTYIPEESEMPDAQGLASLRRLRRKLRLATGDSLPVVQSRPGMQVHQYFGRKSGFDVRQAEHLAALPNVKCFGDDHDMHNTLLWLQDHGRIDDALATFAAAVAPPDKRLA